jgi:hypothetical protein
MGDTQRPFGRPVTCSQCGAESELLKTPEVKNAKGEIVDGGREYYQLRCACQKRKIAASAKASFNDAYKNWASAQATIAELDRINEKERDIGLWNEAWGRARRSAASAKELSETFGFTIPSSLMVWGKRYLGAAWQQSEA